MSEVHSIELYNSLTIKQLNEIARYHLLHGFNRFRIKAAMVNFLHDNQVEIPDYVLNQKRNKVGRPFKPYNNGLSSQPQIFN